MPLRQLPIAETPSQAVDMHDVYDGIAAAFQGEISDNNAEYDALTEHLRQTDELRTRAEIERRDSLISLLYSTGDLAEVVAARDAFEDTIHVLVDHREEFWAGSKGGGTVGGVEAGFKSGIYIKVDQQGELVDTGWRVGPSVSVGAGAAEFSAWENEIDLSFTSSLTPGY